MTNNTNATVNVQAMVDTLQAKVASGEPLTKEEANLMLTINRAIKENTSKKEEKGMNKFFKGWIAAVKTYAAISDMELSAIEANAKAAGRKVVKPAYYAGKAYGYVSETVKLNVEEAIGSNKVVEDVCYSAKAGAETGRYSARENHDARMADSRARKACKAAEEMLENFDC